MSRSRKKVSCYNLKHDKYFKRLVHTINRMLARQGVYLSPSQYRLVVNPWDICDYSSLITDKTSEWYDKGFRK